jgi:dTDP-4-dehydrorhamnose reductase
MKVLITGANGQLGSALVRSAPNYAEIIAVTRQELDLADAGAITTFVSRLRPNLILNAGAYTAVDQAEAEKDLAYAINGAAPAAFANACRAIGTRLIHVSTDYVFDGKSWRPYRPDDAANPLNVYGASKLEGEVKIALCTGLDWAIVRTAWVYTAQGKNFVRTMLRLFGERDRVGVVTDQIGTPTSAASLARCIWRLTASPEVKGVLHYTDAGVASWYDFAVAIYEEAKALRLVDRELEIAPITTAEYKTPAARPLYTVLDKKATMAALDIKLVHWRAELREVLGVIASA